MTHQLHGDQEAQQEPEEQLYSRPMVCNNERKMTGHEYVGIDPETGLKIWRCKHCLYETLR